MIERGNYRSIYCALVDGPDFQAFTPGAKLVFYTLKMTLGPSGIDVVPALVATLVERTGADAGKIEKALKELDAAGWVQRERNVVWIVDGLAHEPVLSLRNQNHRIKIATHVNGLPRLAIVDAFRAHYGLAAAPVEMPSPAPENSVGDGAEMPSHMASKMASHMASKMASQEPSPSREKEKGEGRGKGRRKDSASASDAGAGSSGTGRTGKPTWLTPFADAWRSRYGGEMAAGAAVRSLKRLVDTHGTEEAARRWGIYLAQTPAEYANAPKFASTWGHWERPQLSASRGAPLGVDPAHLATAATIWPRYKLAGLLARGSSDELREIGERLVARGDYPSYDAFRAEIVRTKPWELSEARTDGWAINELAKRLQAPTQVTA